MLQDFFEPCVLMDIKREPDELGGIHETLVEGVSIRCGIAMNSTTTAQIAYQNGAKKIYTIVFELYLNLKRNDYVKRKKDGQIFRVTSDSEDMTTPEVSKVKFRQVSAEAVDV